MSPHCLLRSAYKEQSSVTNCIEDELKEKAKELQCLTQASKQPVITEFQIITICSHLVGVTV